MFSEELYEPDKNTMKLMVDEMQEEIDGLQKSNDYMQSELRVYKEKYGDL